MIRIRLTTTLLVMAISVWCGCNQRTWEEKTYEIQVSTPLDQVKGLLQGYAEGQPLGSEVDSFPQMIEQVRASNPEKAEVVETGLAEIQNAKGNLRAKATELLGKLQ